MDEFNLFVLQNEQETLQQQSYGTKLNPNTAYRIAMLSNDISYGRYIQFRYGVGLKDD